MLLALAEREEDVERGCRKRKERDRIVQSSRAASGSLRFDPSSLDYRSMIYR
jgi:hypothetical protein